MSELPGMWEDADLVNGWADTSDTEIVILAGNHSEAGDWKFRMAVEGNPDAEHAVLLPVMKCGIHRLRDRYIRRAYVTPVIREALLYRHHIACVRARMAMTPGADDDVIFLGDTAQAAA